MLGHLGSVSLILEVRGFLPSSTEISVLPSGLSAIEEMFLRFSKGNVKDLLLKRCEKRTMQV